MPAIETLIVDVRSEEPRVQILRLATFDRETACEIAKHPASSGQRWLVLDTSIGAIDTEQAVALKASLVVSCKGDDLDATCEALAAIAARPQSILVGVDVADVLSAAGAFEGTPGFGEAVVFDGLAKSAPSAFWSPVVGKRHAGLLVQLATSTDGTADDLEALGLAALNWQGVGRVLFTQQDDA